MYAEVSSTAIVYRFGIARLQQKLQSISESRKTGNGYKNTRHQVTGCQTFAQFARGLAQEYSLSLQSHQDTTDQNQMSLRSGNHVLQEKTATCVSEMYDSSAVQKYNRPADRHRRFNTNLAYEKTRGNATNCSLCYYSETINFRKRKFQKKEGSKVVQWCECCRQPICGSCLDTWHSSRQLVSATIPSEELDLLQQKVRSACI